MQRAALVSVKIAPSIVSAKDRTFLFHLRSSQQASRSKRPSEMKKTNF
jgi:hypothetical protein